MTLYLILPPGFNKLAFDLIPISHQSFDNNPSMHAGDNLQYDKNE